MKITDKQIADLLSQGFSEEEINAAAEEMLKADPIDAPEMPDLPMDQGLGAAALEGLGRVSKGQDTLGGGAFTRETLLEGARRLGLPEEMAPRTKWEKVYGAPIADTPSFMDVFSKVVPSNPNLGMWDLPIQGLVKGAGFAADVATDPSTYSPAGPISILAKLLGRATKGSKAASGIFKTLEKVAGHTSEALDLGIPRAAKAASKFAFNRAYKPIDAFSGLKGKGKVSDTLLRLGYRGQDMAEWLPKKMAQANEALNKVLADLPSYDPIVAYDKAKKVFDDYRALHQEPHPMEEKTLQWVAKTMTQGMGTGTREITPTFGKKLASSSAEDIAEAHFDPTGKTIKGTDVKAKQEAVKALRTSNAAAVRASNPEIGDKFNQLNKDFSGLMTMQKPLTMSYARGTMGQIPERNIAPLLFQILNRGLGPAKGLGTSLYRNARRDALQSINEGIADRTKFRTEKEGK